MTIKSANGNKSQQSSMSIRKWMALRFDSINSTRRCRMIAAAVVCALFVAGVGADEGKYAKLVHADTGKVLAIADDSDEARAKAFWPGTMAQKRINGNSGNRATTTRS